MADIPNNVPPYQVLPQLVSDKAVAEPKPQKWLGA